MNSDEEETNFVNREEDNEFKKEMILSGDSQDEKKLN